MLTVSRTSRVNRINARFEQSKSSSNAQEKRISVVQSHRIGGFNEGVQAALAVWQSPPFSSIDRQ
jgi:hypothetical protein